MYMPLTAFMRATDMNVISYNAKHIVSSNLGCSGSKYKYNALMDIFMIRLSKAAVIVIIFQRNCRESVY